ncbi:hypothetical protein PENTCL1PPCAC_11054, partial [Pristionchus entomophagus]
SGCHLADWFTNSANHSKSKELQGLRKDDKFTRDMDLLHSYFPNNITPEQARFLVMGVLLGLAAHCICYVAEESVHNKLSGRPTKISQI